MLQNSFNCENINLICFRLPRHKKEDIGEMGCLVKEQINIYKKHTRQLQYQQLAVEEDLCRFRDRTFQDTFFKIL